MRLEILPLVWITLFLFFGFIWRTWIQFRRYGHLGIIVFKTATWAQRLRDSLLMLLFLGTLLQAAIFAVSPGTIEGTWFFTPPLSVRIAGTILLFGGLLMMLAAQLGMGKSWRVGIDESASPGLVTGGIYRFCRNPIYLAIFTSLVGQLVVLPTWPSLMIFAGVFGVIRSQVYEEEVYLTKTYGQEFADYASRTGRFLPGIGKCLQTDSPLAN